MPAFASASPMGLTSDGAPVNPCNSKHASGPAPSAKGAAGSIMRGAAVARLPHDGKRMHPPCRPATNRVSPRENCMSAEVPQQVQIQVQIDDVMSQGVYANMAMVNHNETEFVL